MLDHGNPDNPLYELFVHMEQEHDILLTDSEMTEIIHIAERASFDKKRLDFLESQKDTMAFRGNLGILYHLKSRNDPWVEGKTLRQAIDIARNRAKDG